jgi:hypothetical protein
MWEVETLLSLVVQLIKIEIKCKQKQPFNHNSKSQRAKD